MVSPGCGESRNISSNPATHHPVSVSLGNSTSISAMVQVDDNHQLDEEAFRFLLRQIREDLPSPILPRYGVLSHLN